MSARLRYGAVATHDDDLALLVFTPKGQARYVTLTTEQAMTCIESLASVLRSRAEALREAADEIDAWEARESVDVLTGGAWSDGVRYGLMVARQIVAGEQP